MTLRFLICATFLCLAGCPRPEAPPNLVLITVDTLRPDRLHCYGGEKAISAAIDSLAERGVLFEQCYSQASLTIPSLSSLMTGRYPSEIGARNNSSPLTSTDDCLAAALKRRGYRTAAFVCNFNLRPEMRFNRGFDHYDAEFNDPEPNRPDIVERKAPDATDAALAWLERNVDTPFFLWIHYQDPHGPYTPPPGFTLPAEQYPGAELPILKQNYGRHGIPKYQAMDGSGSVAEYRARYDGEIRFLDHHLERLLKALDLNGTVVAFTADHGESMGEHAYWFSHGQDLYNELIRVPLIVAGARVEPGRTSDPVCLVDLFPTFSALAGEVKEHHGIDLLDPASRKKARIIFSETDNPPSKSFFKAVVMGPWKLIHSRFANNPSLLFNMADDPLERENIIDAHPEVVKNLKKIIDTVKMRTRENEPLDLTPEEIKVLEALGYTGK